MQIGMDVGLVPGHIVLDGDPAAPKKGAQPPSFWPMSNVAKRLDEVHGGSVLSLYAVTDGRHSSDSEDRMFEGHCRSCPAILV